MKTTVWVYAQDEDEAKLNATGHDGYSAWDNKDSAIEDGKDGTCKCEGDHLFKVTILARDAELGTLRAKQLASNAGGLPTVGERVEVLDNDTEWVLSEPLALSPGDKLWCIYYVDGSGREGLLCDFEWRRVARTEGGDSHARADQP